MSHTSPRQYKYRNHDSILTVGIDINGRVFSYITRNNEIIVQDIYIKIPLQQDLESKGWERIYE